MRTFFGFAIGIFLGALVGATIGLLLTPSSGKEVRVHIRQRGTVLTEEVQHIALEGRQELRGRMAQLRAPQAIELPPRP